jgi:hypothetical protein
MKKFDIYAGMRDKATYQCTIEAEHEGEALKYAYQLAEKEYRFHEGCNGILSWEECEEELRESRMLDDLTENEYENRVDEYYLTEIDSWVDYYVIEKQ